jgi:hypothetical protein
MKHIKNVKHCIAPVVSVVGSWEALPVGSWDMAFDLKSDGSRMKHAMVYKTTI